MKKKDWFQSIIEDGIQELKNEQKEKGWFSIQSISNVPYISYPDLTPEQCAEVQEQVKNVLRISRNENHYKEVAITYSLKEPDKEKKYKKVLGDYSKVPIMNDIETSFLIEEFNKKNDLAIISLHNHPNDSGFSLNDLLIFTENSSIRLMNIVNKKGEVSFLYRQSYIDLHNIVTKNIVEMTSDLEQRKNQLLKNSGSFSLDKLLSVQERIDIAKESLLSIRNAGVLVSNYVGKNSSSDLLFNKKQLNYHPMDICFDAKELSDKGNLVEDYVYAEEDGYDFD